MTEIDAARVLLGVSEGDGEVRVRERYRLLAFAWHPDRFLDNETLRPAAQAEMARINEAYNLLVGRRQPVVSGSRRESGSKRGPRRYCGHHTYTDTSLRCDRCGQLVCQFCADATCAGDYRCQTCR